MSLVPVILYAIKKGTKARRITAIAETSLYSIKLRDDGGLDKKNTKSRENSIRRTMPSEDGEYVGITLSINIVIKDL